MLLFQPVVLTLAAISGRYFLSCGIALLLIYLDSSSPLAGQWIPDPTSLALSSSYFLLAAAIVIVAETAKRQRQEREDILRRQLHDSVARYLTLSVMSLREAADDPAVAEGINHIHSARTHTRALLTGVELPTAALPDLLNDLRHAGLSVAHSGPRLRLIGDTECKAIAAIMGELTVNILKYADRSQPVHIAVTPTGRSLTLTNVPHRNIAATDSSQLGCQLIRTQAQRIGADLDISFTPESWRLRLNLPQEPTYAL